MPADVVTRGLPPADRWPAHVLSGVDGLRLELFSCGTLRGIWRHGLLISRLLGDPFGGGSMRLYLRQRWTDGRVTPHEIVGLNAISTFGFHNDHAVWSGRTESKHGDAALSFSVVLRFDEADTRWRWTVSVTSEAGPVEWDAVLVQDVALAAEGMVRNNEKYPSQYLDHRIEQHADHGPVILSRQALPQAGKTHPWLLSACAPAAIGAITDGGAFFGTTHKADGHALHADTLALTAEVIQQESGAHVLQSASQTARPGETCRVTFASVFVADHPAASSADDLSHVDTLFENTVVEPVTPGSPTEDTTRKNRSTSLRSGDPATDADLQAWFGPRDNWRHVETLTPEQHDGSTNKNASSVASFFHGPDRHVATLGKDIQLRRGHGHMLRTGRHFLPNDTAVGVTVYQHGVFGSQFTLGNLTFGQLTGIVRDPVNLQPAAGLRLAIDLGDGRGFVQLAVATAFELAPGWSRWWYRLGDRVLTVRAAASPDAPLLRYELRVVEGKPVRVRLSQHFSFGERENGYTTTLRIDRNRGVVTATPDPATPFAQKFPDARCALAFDDPALLQHLDTTPLDPAQPDGDHYPYLHAETSATATLRWSFSGAPDEPGMPAQVHPEMDAVCNAADAYWAELRQPIHAAWPKNGADTGLARLREVVPWFVHNAMIHLSLPHGLEQFGGAAWGTRDVCQGSVELLLALERHDVMADVLRTVFRHQHRQTGDWPQWFMHAPFNHVQAGDSHGDVVVWPLYALCCYLEATGDTALLDEPVGYTEADRHDGFPFTAPEHDEPIRAHVRRAVERVESQRIPGTALPRYGHGDWNDSLQPAEPWMADRMVSSWTVALLQHTLARLAKCVASSDPAWADELAQHAAAVADDFRKWCVVDTPDGGQQVAGILLFNEDLSTAEPLLHPADARTGIEHSLIPMNRALLAGLFGDALADHHRDVIANRLMAPDGVRLMEKPPRYTGGASRFFQRAETAAFFGREIGLMYVHAHLRYAETRIAAGDLDDARTVLNQVNPVALPAHVPNAAPRQANAYFSSSDARFATRHQADAEHDRVFAGTVPVDGGWRIYSSGPGIFLHLLRRALDER